MTGSLSRQAILAGLHAPVRRDVAELTVFERIDSTQDWLNARPVAAGADVVVTTNQQAGRGRLGNRWRMPPGSGLGLSLAMRFERLPEPVAAVTLACGVALAEDLHAAGVPGVQVKWPNDLVVDGAKLAGILTESQSQATGLRLVVGVGLNLLLPADWVLPAANGDHLPATDLARAAGAEVPDANRYAALVLNALYRALTAFARDGLAPVVAAWPAVDYLDTRAVRVTGGEQVICGTAAGIAADGALNVDTADGPVRVLSGTVRVSEAVHG